MMLTRNAAVLLAVASSSALLAATALPAATPLPAVMDSADQQQQRPVWEFNLRSVGTRAKVGLPDFVAPSGDAELREAAATVADVLWDDLHFEQEFYMIPRAESASIPAAPTPTSLAVERWTQLGADYVVHAVLNRSGDTVGVRLRLVPIRGERAGGQPFAREYGNCRVDTIRACAHAIADDMHWELFNLQGVAQTRLAFVSDRDSQRVRTRPIPDSGVSKEIYIADYDGANQRPVTANRSLTFGPAWEPTGSSLAYMLWPAAQPGAIFINTLDGRPVRRLLPDDGHSYGLPAWSPDGSMLAFDSNRSGNTDIWVVNRDGSGLRQVTNHPEVDTSPTWAPTGNQVAFVSGRSGSRQIYVVNPDGTGLQKLTSASGDVDRPTWSALGFIAFTSGSHPGHDISLYEFRSGQVTVLTDGLGDNGSPAVASNGRHIAFKTTRWGREQIAIIDRRGQNIRQITSVGTNHSPSWSRARGR